MKKERDIKVVFIGRYDKSEVLAGNVKVAKRIFNNYTKYNRSFFIEYFFDGKEYNYIRKFFGSEFVDVVNESKVFRLGIISMLFALFKLRPEIVHIVTNERYCSFAYIYKLLSKVTFYFNVHGLYIYELGKLRNTSTFTKIKNIIAEYIFLKYSNKIIVLTRNTIKIIEKYYKIDRNKYVIIPNGIDLCFSQISNQRKYEAKDNLKLVFISDLCRKEKGFSFLKESLEEIEYPLELYVIGRNNKPELIEFRNKNIKVYLINKMTTSKYAEFLIDKDIYISSSFYDLFNISLMEAMATGIIPIVTKQTGSSIFVTQGVNGFRVDYGDRKELISIINYISCNPQIIKTISSNALNIYNSISWDKIYKKYNELYQNLIRTN